MPSIKWDPGDSSGERTLACVVENGRFNHWKIMPEVQGEEAIAVGDGRGYIWAHRTDECASMDLLIAHSNLALLYEFVKWAKGGSGTGSFGRFTIVTDDADGNEYEDCQIRTKADIDVSPPDPETLDHTLSMTVVNVALSPVPLIIQHE